MAKYPKDFKFERNCPQCNTLIKYKSYQGYESGIKLNSKCRKCGSGWSKGLTKETSDSIRMNAKNGSKTKKEKFKSGELHPWNKGLTKETSQILKKNAEAHRGFKHTEETKRIIGKHSKERWDSGYYDNQYGDNHTEFKYYQHKVHRLTDKVKHLIEGYDESKRGKMGVSGAYQIDHIVDIKYGFDNNIPAEDIAHISNLQFIPWEDNNKKAYYGKAVKS